MRTLRLSMVVTVIVALLGGLGAVVAAQDETADPMAPAVVTGTITEVSEDFKGWVSVSDDTVLKEGYGATNRWESNDPRLSGTSTYTGNWHEYQLADFQVEAATRVLENDDGRWVGTATAFVEMDRSVGPPINTDTVILYGEGAYDGLTAYVLTDSSVRPAAFVGAIFPGEMPSMPELPAQDEGPAPVTFVTGTVVEQYDHPGANTIVEGPPEEVRGWLVGAESYGVIEQVIEWSDPRLPSQHWMNMNLAFILDPQEAQGPPEGAMAVTTSNLLEGPEGSWRGTGRAVEGLDDRYSLYELTGEGAYDGLWAVLRMTPGADASGPLDHSYEGYIFETDPMVFPAQPESVTTEGMQTHPEEPSTAVVAQDDGEAPSATHVTGTQSSMSMTSEPEEWEDGDVLYRRDARTERTVEWSDPRLPSRVMLHSNANWHALGDGGVGAFATAVRLVGEDGDWAGTTYSLVDPESSIGLYVLTGSGAYEGLWAMIEGSLVEDADGNLVIDADGQVTTIYDGYIFESEPPPMPDPIEPPAE